MTNDAANIPPTLFISDDDGLRYEMFNASKIADDCQLSWYIFVTEYDMYFKFYYLSTKTYHIYIY